MVSSGWVMHGAPMKTFAEANVDYDVILRRGASSAAKAVAARVKLSNVILFLAQWVNAFYQEIDDPQVAASFSKAVDVLQPVDLSLKKICPYFLAL